MYLDIYTQVPEIPGRIIRKIVGNTTYIYYLYGQKYDPVRKFSIPQRASIGKLAEDGRMIPNENFHKYLPEIRLPGDSEEIFRSSSLHIGVYIILGYLLEELILPGILGLYFHKTDVDALLDLVACSLIKDGGFVQDYMDYASSHPLFSEEMKPRTMEQNQALLDGISEKQSSCFLKRWSEKHHSDDDTLTISYRSARNRRQTGTLSVMSVEEMLAENTSGDDANYFLAANSKNGLPIFYEDAPGVIMDVAQLQLFMDKAKTMGFKKLNFIFDNGCISEDLIAYLDDERLDYTLVFQGGAGCVSKLIEENRGTFESKKQCEIDGSHIHALTVKTRLLNNKDSKELNAHIFYCSEEVSGQQKNIMARMKRMTQFLKCHERKKLLPTSTLKRYFDLLFDPHKKFFQSAREKSQVVKQEMNLCGYMVIVTSTSLTAREALDVYRRSCRTEGRPPDDELLLPKRPPETLSGIPIASRIFLDFLIQIVKKKFLQYLTKEPDLNNNNRGYMTIPEVLKEMEKIEMVKWSDNIYRLDHALTKAQKAILNAFGQDEKFVLEQTLELSIRLKETMTNDIAAEWRRPAQNDVLHYQLAQLKQHALKKRQPGEADDQNDDSSLA